MHLDEIVSWIDRAFGAVSFSVEYADVEVLKRILGERGYQSYLQDQVNRQIIRDYLTNAVVLGVITEGGLAAFAAQVATEDGRATLALHMLMSSVEEAKDLSVGNNATEALKPLKLVPEERPSFKLVPKNSTPA